MARLNESTTSVESIETLKRRFVRQNRELARVNSMQSLRIRSLESEVSHLLAENVSLREQTISLGQEMERYEAAKLLHDGVYDIKTKLENKLTELNNLVIGLGALPRQFAKTYSERVDGGRDSAQSNWDLRHHEANHEPTFPPEQDWRLPIIPEDGDYTRDEPGSYELVVSTDGTGTPKPQLAVDPTSRTRLEQNDPYLEPTTIPTDDERVDGDSSGINESFLPPTLETRKKRKYNATWTDDRSTLDSEPMQPHNSPGGSKKREIQRSTEGDTFGASPENDDFKFSRTPVFRKCERDEPSGGLPVKDSFEMKSDSMCDGQPKRKALKPKNANVDLVSGRRRTPTKGKHSGIPSFHGDAQSGEDRTSKAATADASFEHGQSIQTKKWDVGVSANQRDEVERKSTTRNSDFTKEDSDHSSASISLTNEASTALSDPPSRPTRRQRAVVSYAEPNLRDKMRRSNNEFIAAVGNGQSRRASNSQDTKTETCDGISGRANSRASSMVATGTFSEESSTHQMNSVSQRKRKVSPSLDSKSVSGKYGASDDSTDASPIKMSPSYERHSERKIPTELQTDIEGCVHQPALGNTGDASIEVGDIRKTAPYTQKQPRRHSSNQRSHSRAPLHQQNRVLSGTQSPDASSPSFLLRVSPSGDPVMDEIVAPSETSQATVSKNPHDQSIASLEIASSQTRRTQRVSARRKSMML